MTVQEIVDLPDARAQLLVHPLDLPEARKCFVASFWLSLAASPVTFFSFAVVLMTISNNYVTPILAPLINLICAHCARSYMSREAWAHIPRKRQDRDRELPLSWTILESTVLALLLLAGIVVGLQWLRDPGFPAGVGAYAVGMGGAMAFVLAATLIVRLIRARPSRRLLPEALGLGVLVGTTVYGYGLLSGGADPGAWRTPDILTGAAILLGMQLFWWVWQGWRG